ncbi:MAG: trypsin-like peptidase domain-containing protein [bacterium]|nr:trypsin-like peptidase domain-containing protein [bacterium]
MNSTVHRILLGVLWALWTCLLPTKSLPAQDAAAVIAAMEQATVAAIAKAEQSVVAIARVPRNRTAPDRAQSNALSLGLSLGLDDPLTNPDFVPTFFGSGVVISEDGYIVTCSHVLDDPKQNDYYVWLDRRAYPARVTGVAAKVSASDPFSDLAVIKIDDQRLQPIEFGDTSNLRKGQFVLALGNPDAIARDGQASASWGMISNLNRMAPSQQADSSAIKESIHEYGTLIQTDARLGLGTSGGALIDLDGKMIGLTTSLSARLGVESSAGFAIAVDKLFLRVVSQLKLGKLPEFGFLGIQPEELRITEKRRGMRGARVSVVLPGLPGDEAGLRPQDVIIQVDDEPIHDRNDLFRELSSAAAGQSVDLLVHRRQFEAARPNLLKLTARVSKKLVSTSRPGYARNAFTAWRGMLVEYATAIPSELTQAGIWRTARSQPQIVVSEVEPDSPAWQAGLRPGNGIFRVNGKTPESPEDFYSMVEASSGTVKMEIVEPNGTISTSSVPSESTP